MRRFGIILLVLIALGFVKPERALAETVTFRVIAVNPSKDKKQITKVKKYLPKEVTPKDVLDAGNLELEYDSEKSIYYVYKNDVELKPTEIKIFEIEIDDIWIVHEQKLADIEERIESVLAHTVNTEYYGKARAIADGIYPRLEEIRSGQRDESVSRQRHIGIYRENQRIIEDVKEDIDRLERILVTAGGPPAPEMLADTQITSDAPSKNMTWIVVFVIVIFVGLLAGVLFFTWQQQARLTKDVMSQTRKTAFPESEGETENDEPGNEK